MEVVKDISIAKVNLLADFILQTYGPMSHLKLQKLLFYCEAYHLVKFNRSLINEDFQAWMHGPVCYEIYQSLKGESVLHSDIDYTEKDDPKAILSRALTFSQMGLLKDILNDLSTWTGGELEYATHNEEPWIKAREGYAPADRCNVVISKDLMKAYYTKEINGEIS